MNKLKNNGAYCEESSLGTRIQIVFNAIAADDLRINTALCTLEIRSPSGVNNVFAHPVGRSFGLVAFSLAADSLISKLLHRPSICSGIHLFT